MLRDEKKMERYMINKNFTKRIRKQDNCVTTALPHKICRDFRG